MTLETTSAEETIKLGEKIGSRLAKGDVLALQGGLAAGKTTITKGIALGLGITEPITSPTFTLISEYSGRLNLYHMDVYRLDSSEAFVDLGAEELVYGDGVCVIEWSEKIMDELPDSAIVVTIETLPDGRRSINLENWPYGDLSA